MKIIFLCSGNTCRSPMAEGYLNALHLPDVIAQSRGLGFDGDAVSENSVAVMKEYGIDISSHLSKALSYDDLDADRIICMTASHKNALVSAGVNGDIISVLGDGISDPFGGDVTVYRKCRDEIINAVNALVFSGGFVPFSVKIADFSDAASIEALEKECFSSPWSENAISESMQAGTMFFVAKNDDGVLGYAGMSAVLDEGYITNIAVTQNHRNGGIGSYLIARLIAQAVKDNLQFISLEVRASNENAIKLYNKFGFSKEGCRKNYYTKPCEDALIMTKRF